MPPHPLFGGPGDCIKNHFCNLLDKKSMNLESAHFLFRITSSNCMLRRSFSEGRDPLNEIVHNPLLFKEMKRLRKK